MTDTKSISWYRTKIDRSKLKELTEKDDLRAFIHAFSFFLIYIFTTTAALILYQRQMWFWMAVAAYLHSVFLGFLGTGAAVHELTHGTAFRRKRLNSFFLYLFSFLSWSSPVHFRESHHRHHRFTGFDGVDKEIKPEPIPLRRTQVAGWFLFDWANFKRVLGTHIRYATGNTDADFFAWSPLFPEGAKEREKLVKWSRFLLAGHGLLIVLFIYLKLWILIYTVNFGYFFASFLVHSCEMLQHSGFRRNVPDWRLNASTAEFGPLMSFLYWNMNYHCDHHMYAGVPFYKLPNLHEVLKPDIAEPIHGYWQGLVHLRQVGKRQKKNPEYRFIPRFPDTAHPPKYT